MEAYSTTLTLTPRSSTEERQAALCQIYTQVLERQPYAYERKTLAQAEQDFLKGKIGVKRFLKLLGSSEIYLNSFYYNVSNLKSLDWCFKHFMGRAPYHHEEVRYYSNILMQQGFEALITALLDSEEYRKIFGSFTVPHPHDIAFYPSPKAYWETRKLNHEHFGQRGWIVPTLYWHQLGLNCDAGVCQRPEAMDSSPVDMPEGEPLQAELLEFLKALGPNQARQVVAAMSSEQKAALFNAIH